MNKREYTLSHFRSDDAESTDIGQDFHGQVAVGHATVDLQVLEIGSRVAPHALDDSTSLESVGLESCASNVGGIGILRHAYGGVSIQRCNKGSSDGPMRRPLAEGSQ
jgi:hypothetical protein